MAKKKYPDHPAPDLSGSVSRFARLLEGPRAKWLFFGIYLLVTIFLFREFLFNGSLMLFGSDTVPDGVYTRSYYQQYHAEAGGIPRWNPFILGGLPFIDAMHGDTFYPAAWMVFFMPLFRALGLKLVLHVLLAGIFMYLFLRTIRLRKEAAFLGGLMYMLAPSFVSWVYGGHDAKMYVIALLPLAFACLEKGMQKPSVRWFAALGGVMGLMILTSHVQMAYYSYWALGLYFLFRLFAGGVPDDTGSFAWPEAARRTGLFVAAVVLALAFGAVQLLPAYKFTTSQSVRAGELRTGYEYATSWSMHPEEAAGMIVPDFPGMNRVDPASAETQTYWGRNPFKLNAEYHGIIPLVFGILGLVFLTGWWRWFYLGLAGISLVYALGANTPFYHLFYSLVPGVKNFRAPGMIIFLFGFSFVVLAAAFVSSLLDGRTRMKPGDRRLVWAVVSITALSLVVSVWGRGFFDAWAAVFGAVPPEKQAALAANIPSFTRDLWRVVLILAVGLLGCWMFLSRNMSVLAFTVLIGLAAAIDGSIVDSRFIRTLDPARYPGYTAPDQSVRELQTLLASSPQPFRIFSSFSGHQGANYYAMFGIQAADGMHNNELQTYERFRGASSGNLTREWVAGGKLDVTGLARNNYLKVAGVRYIPLSDGQGGVQLLPNESALDRAFIVHDYRAVETDEAAVASLADPALDPARTAVITGTPGIPADATATGSTVTAYEPFDHGFTVTGRFAAPGLLVMTENRVPYWNAAVDGQPAPIYTAYGTFMAVPCPAGTHTVTFTFRSTPYQTGKALTLAAFGILALLLAGPELSRLRKGTPTP